MMAYLLQALELVYDVLCSPVATLLRISREELYKPGILVWLFPIIVGTITLSVGQEEGGYFFITALISSAIGLFIMTAFVHLASTLLGGHGSIRGLLSCFLYAGIPSNFVLLTGWLDSVFPSFIWSFLSSCTSIWLIVLYVIGVAKNYNFSYLRATVALFFPAIVLGLVLFLGIFLLFTSVLGAMETALLG